MSSISRATALTALACVTTGCGAIRAFRHGACASMPFSAALRDTGPLVEGTVEMRRSSTAIRYAMILPRNVPQRSIQRVVYLLPGRGGTARDAVANLGYGAVAQAIVRAGATPFALLAIDSGESYFHPRASGEDRLALVTDALPRIARWLLSPAISYEALVGMSMGGYGALLAAERNSGRYRAVAVAAPALFSSFAEEDRAIGDGFDNAAQFATYDVFAHAAQLAATPVMIRVGYDDPFFANVKAFAKHVQHADVAYIDHGCHDDDFWRLTARELIAFASGRT